MLRSILKSIRSFVTMVEDKEITDHKLGFKNYDMKGYWEKELNITVKVPIKLYACFRLLNNLACLVVK